MKSVIWWFLVASLACSTAAQADRLTLDFTGQVNFGSVGGVPLSGSDTVTGRVTVETLSAPEVLSTDSGSEARWSSDDGGVLVEFTLALNGVAVDLTTDEPLQQERSVFFITDADDGAVSADGWSSRDGFWVSSRRQTNEGDRISAGVGVSWLAADALDDAVVSALVEALNRPVAGAIVVPTSLSFVYTETGPDVLSFSYDITSIEASLIRAEAIPMLGHLGTTALAAAYLIIGGLVLSARRSKRTRPAP